MYVVIIMMEVQYAIIAYNVGQRFSRLNTSLEKILKNGGITDRFRQDLGVGARLYDRNDARQLLHCSFDPSSLMTDTINNSSAGGLQDQEQLVAYIRPMDLDNTRIRKSKAVDSSAANGAIHDSVFFIS